MSRAAVLPLRRRRRPRRADLIRVELHQVYTDLVALDRRRRGLLDELLEAEATEGARS